MIRQALAGKRIAITGTTGFLGTALLERLLRTVPDCEIVLLLRAGRRSTVAQRAAREIFRNDAFDRLRQQAGAGFDEMIARRVTVIAGDVGRDGLGLDDDGRAALAACDIVMHSAATVAFDSPLDGAVEVNLLGPTRLAQTLQALGSTAHLVSVSTCYVAGNRRGAAPEQLLSESPFFLDIDWRAEVDAARRARADAEAESRTPELLARFRKEARRELGAAGTPLLSEKTEQRRSHWVKQRMIQAGRARATSLGWPDAYAYTKALGERALVESRGDVPGLDRAPVDHRVGAGRAEARLDPRLPHGRAGDHLLRPRLAEGVPRRARGHRRRHPGRPRRRRGVRRRRPRPGPGPCPRGEST